MRGAQVRRAVVVHRDGQVGGRGERISLTPTRHFARLLALMCSRMGVCRGCVQRGVAGGDEDTARLACSRRHSSSATELGADLPLLACV